MEEDESARYELDDGPLTDEQINIIRKLSKATEIPQENFNKCLFDIKGDIDDFPGV